MHRNELVAQIKKKKSVLCVGLDTDASKLPLHLQNDPNGILLFNKAIIDATKEYTVAYKINTAFYEAMGIKGWEIMQDTLAYIPKEIFTIADAKRGDIGNTATQYAKTFFETYPYDSVTVAPYMGADSVQPFLAFENKWAIVLGLTSNPGSQDFQMLSLADQSFLYERVLKTVSSWGTSENTMFVIGATRADQLQNVRKILPHHFLLIPGVGAQGGDVATVCEHALTDDGGILINVSRGIIYASSQEDFASKAQDSAKMYQQEMQQFIK
ncbi:MAG: orotidine-5'-phosphate decarboxylase [Bacteroidota bacterium]|jgi:orotidine-5'-phosphate decarboxylase